MGKKLLAVAALLALPILASACGYYGPGPRYGYHRRYYRPAPVVYVPAPPRVRVW